MASICYNLTYQCRVDANNRPLASRPRLFFGGETSWEILFFQGDFGGNTPADLSGIVSCRAAVDRDYSVQSTPMCRTVSGIDLSRAATGVITVPLDANTQTFRTALGDSREIPAIFELQGFDAAGLALFASFEITAQNLVDPAGGETPAAPQDDLASKAWTKGQIAQTLILEYSADGTNWHTAKGTGDRFFRMRHGSAGTPSAAVELPAAGNVSSVNGKTGAVTLQRADLPPVVIDGGTVSGGTISNMLGGRIYKFGTLDSLTVSAVENSDAEAVIIFLSGATATVTDFPAALMWLNGSSPACEANATYCISVQNNLAVCGKFTVAG